MKKEVRITTLGIVCAYNDICLEISKGDYTDWAAASGQSRNTANRYWSKAKQLRDRELRGEINVRINN